jgi:hypothetical protein
VNLNSIVGGCVAAVNPWVIATIQASAGYAAGPDGTQAPAYAAPVPIQAQVQSLQYNDIVQLDSLNIQGERRAMYLNGDWEGIVRADQKGGDLITLPDGSVWLVALVLENWSDTGGWVKVAVTMQNGS